MVSGLQSFKLPIGLLGLFASNRNRGEQGSVRWELRITFGQIVLLWVALALAMLTVFLFGFHRGRDDGLAIAFEEYSEQTVRLPIVQPVATSSREGDAGAATNSVKAQNSLGVSQLEQGSTSGQSSKDKAAKEPQFDFSSNKATVSAEQAKREPSANELAALLDKKQNPKEPTAGLSSKPTLELFSGEMNAGAEKQKQITKLGGENQPAGGISTGWYIQAAATQVSAEASGSIRKLQRAGYPTVVEKAQIRDRTYLRVLVGPYPDKEGALKAKDKLARAGAVSGVPFVKFVK
jgi:cell division septation protein DedD